jgi:hypothetical protein
MLARGTERGVWGGLRAPRPAPSHPLNNDSINFARNSDLGAK